MSQSNSVFVFSTASEEQVKDRAALWDQPVTEYVKLAERYLGFQQPGSVYGFTDAADGCKRVSFCYYILKFNFVYRN